MAGKYLRSEVVDIDEMVQVAYYDGSWSCQNTL